jgi:hypothetical protein
MGFDAHTKVACSILLGFGLKSIKSYVSLSCFVFLIGYFIIWIFLIEKERYHDVAVHVCDGDGVDDDDDDDDDDNDNDDFVDNFDDDDRCGDDIGDNDDDNYDNDDDDDDNYNDDVVDNYNDD